MYFKTKAVSLSFVRISVRMTQRGVPGLAEISDKSQSLPLTCNTTSLTAKRPATSGPLFKRYITAWILNLTNSLNGCLQDDCFSDVFQLSAIQPQHGVL